MARENTLLVGGCPLQRVPAAPQKGGYHQTMRSELMDPWLWKTSKVKIWSITDRQKFSTGRSGSQEKFQMAL